MMVYHGMTDPAYIFNSAAHGDPSTPIFKSFANEKYQNKTTSTWSRRTT